MERRTFTYVALALLVWAISGTATAGYYFTQYNIYHNEYSNLANEFNALSGAMGNISGVMESISLRVNILVSYGNGTKAWHNNTVLPVGSTAFTAILSVANTRYNQTGGILITSVDGFANNSTHAWFYWYRDAEKTEWILWNYSCAEYILHRGDTVAFTYQSYSYTTWPPPFPT